MEYGLNDIVEMKKEHPCHKSNEWKIIRMGADIRIESHHAMIHGVKGFSGAQVTSPDLRGGAALVVAGLIADGVTEVSAIHHIKRGYEQFVEKLQALGAHVEHATVPDPVIY